MKMMPNRYNSLTVSSVANTNVFFDANILIYLFGNGTPTTSNWENQYATLYTKLSNQNNRFIVDYIVISEFVNRVIKLEYKNYLITNSLSEQAYSYKTYRNSSDGQQALADIYLTVKDDILSYFEVVEQSYSKTDLISMSCVDQLDFSDKAIIKICENNAYILLTNDQDYTHTTVDILSCHWKICP